MTHVGAITTPVLDKMLAFLAPLFLDTVDANLATARHAAARMLASYDAQTDQELRLAAEIIAFGFGALDALSRAADPELSTKEVLRLRGNANALNRAGQQNQRLLDRLHKQRMSDASAEWARSEMAYAEIAPAGMLQTRTAPTRTAQSATAQSGTAQSATAQSGTGQSGTARRGMTQTGMRQTVTAEPRPRLLEAATARAETLLDNRGTDRPTIAGLLALAHAAAKSQPAAPSGASARCQPLSRQQRRAAQRQADKERRRQAEALRRLERAGERTKPLAA